MAESSNWSIRNLFDKGPASQGTPPNSPAAVSAFSRVVGAASQTNKQNQVQGNPLGIAAVLLQGAQGKSAGQSDPRGKHGRIYFIFIIGIPSVSCQGDDILNNLFLYRSFVSSLEKL